MAEITGIAHVELSVSDMDRSANWYNALLGSHEVFRGANDERGFQAIAILEPTSRLVLAFTEHKAADGPFRPQRVGLDHLSFRAADKAAIDAWIAKLDELNVAHDGIDDQEFQWAINFRDPDDIALEIIARKPAPPR